jgi:DnaJ homolog subfamily C member 17
MKRYSSIIDFTLLGPYDTTVRLKYSLATHPTLTTPAALSNLLQPFGVTDTSSIVLTLKPPKKAPHKPPKYGVALVPFEQIGPAFDAVCASGLAERGLDGIEVGWVEGKEPQILGWLKRIGKLATPTTRQEAPSTAQNKNAGSPLPKVHTTAHSSLFSSFPESFVSHALYLERRSMMMTGGCFTA